MEKKDIRILFNMDNMGRITQICIADFNREHYEEWPRHLYKIYSMDIGNCLAEWDEWNLVDVLLFMFQFVFESEKVIDKFFNELYKVKEFKSDIRKYAKIKEDYE